MTIKVKTPDGGMAEFPDGTSHEVINKAMSAKFSPKPENVDFDAATMIKNIPSSASQFVGDITFPFRHPIQAGEGLWNLGSGLVQKAIPGEQGNEKYADAAGQFFSNRYGGVDEIKTTAMNDPVGLLADASLLVTGGGTAAAKLPGQAGKIGKATQTAGRAIDPLTSITNLTRKGVGKLIPKDAPLNMINSSVKWNTTTSMDKRNRMANTMLDEKIMPTYSGVYQTDKYIRQLSSKIDDVLESATKSGKKIKVDDLWGDFEKGLNKIDSPEVPESGKMAKAYLDQIQIYVDDWNRQGITELTPTQVQQFKKNLYKHVNFDNLDKSAQVVSEGQDAARHNIAQTTKRKLEEISPSIKKDNERLGNLLELNKELPRKASRIENRNTLSLNTAPMGGLGALMDYGLGMPGVATTLGIGGSMLDMPRPKARNAIMLRGMQNATMTDGKVIPYFVRQGMLNTGRLND